jgi:hypothetical protein
MNDNKKTELAFDLLNDAEVMQEFDDSVWLQVDRDTWLEFISAEEGEEG